MVAGGHDHRDRPERAGAFDVERRVADDQHLLRAERVADQRVGAARCQRGQPPPVHVVGPEGPDREVRPEPRRGELDPRPFLDVAGQQSQQHPLRLVQPANERRDARQRRDVPAIADLLDQAARIRLEEVVEALLHGLPREPGRLHHVKHDALIGFAPQVVLVDGAAGPVDPLERGLDRAAPGAPGAQQGAVHVEEEQAHGSARRERGERAEPGHDGG